MKQHDASFQHHLRKARYVVLYKSKPVGAGAVTDLEGAAHSDRKGATCQINSQSRPISDPREDSTPTLV
jgi:hypothetical protein